MLIYYRFPLKHCNDRHDVNSLEKSISLAVLPQVGKSFLVRSERDLLRLLCIRGFKAYISFEGQFLFLSPLPVSFAEANGSQGLAPRVMLLEEAGQILEAHVLGSLVPSIEHLILIGDPLQLRPTLNNYCT